jgi:uncharacterized protein YprB with RNaseH-like and TPR domain
VDLLKLLETRGVPIEAAELGDLPPLPAPWEAGGSGVLQRLSAAQEKKRESALDDLAREGGGRVLRLKGQRVIVFRRRHPPSQLDSLFGGQGRMVPRLLTAYTRQAEFDAVAGGKLLFLDTETTGLSHGTGTFAFLIGLAVLRGQDVISYRLFIPDPGDEPLALRILLGFVRRCPFLVSYNGKGFDLHVLRTRLILCFPRRFTELEPALIPHLDLLHLSRRLWRHRLERVGLQDLEREVLGLTRHGDVSGSLIPAIYFDHLFTGRREGLLRVLEHNLQDVLSMVALFEVIAGRVLSGQYADPAEATAIARLMLEKGMASEALALLSRLDTVPDREPARSAWRALVLKALKTRKLEKPRRRALAQALEAEFPADQDFAEAVRRLGKSPA